MNKSIVDTGGPISLGGNGLVTQLRNGAKGVAARFRQNIVESGRNPVSTALGFALAWGLFFFVLYALPTPKDYPQPARPASPSSSGPA